MGSYAAAEVAEATKSKSVWETEVQARRPLDHNQAAIRIAGEGQS